MCLPARLCLLLLHTSQPRHLSLRMQAAYQSSNFTSAHGDTGRGKSKLQRNVQRERLIAAVAAAALAQLSPGRKLLELEAQATILRRMRDALKALEAHAGVKGLGARRRTRKLQQLIASIDKSGASTSA